MSELGIINKAASILGAIIYVGGMGYLWLHARMWTILIVISTLFIIGFIQDRVTNR